MSTDLQNRIAAQIDPEILDFFGGAENIIAVEAFDGAFDCERGTIWETIMAQVTATSNRRGLHMRPLDERTVQVDFGLISHDERMEIVIALTFMDDYDITLRHYFEGKLTREAALSGVYADQLGEIVDRPFTYLPPLS